MTMKTNRLLTALLFATFLTNGVNQAQTTILSSDPQNCCSPQQPSKKEAKKWVRSKVWNEGFQANPYTQIDCLEFYTQYHKNPVRWQKMFQWLAKNDINQLKPGRYPIDGEHCYANVEDATLHTPAEQKIESHKKYIDLQYTGSGTERFGIIPNPSKATVREAYKPDIMFWNYDKPHYIDSTPETFFLFFPSNYHQACVYPQGKKEAPQKVRKVCVKMEYIQ